MAMKTHSKSKKEQISIVTYWPKKHTK